MEQKQFDELKKQLQLDQEELKYEPAAYPAPPAAELQLDQEELK